MKLRSEAVIRDLKCLEHQITEVRRLAAALAQAFRDGDLGGSTRATADARRAFDAIAAAAMSVKRQVVAVDGLGDTLESFAELAIRAIRLVVLAELSHLREVVEGPAALGRARGLFRAPFQNIGGVVSFVHERFDCINGIWTPYRRGAATSENRVLYREAVRTAQHAVNALGVDSALARFLRDGRARRDWPAVDRACTRIAAALDVRLDAEPDRRLFTHASPSPSPSSDPLPRRRP
jgi:hypothetical protein